MKNQKNIFTWLLCAGVIPFGLYYLSLAVEDWSGKLPNYGQVNWVEIDDKGYTFFNQDSIEVNLNDVDQNVVVANYFFTSCPTICPAMMRNMQLVQEGFSAVDEVKLLSFTVDPKRDSPKALKKFAQKYTVIMPHWQLLTGEKKELYSLARNDFNLSALEGTIDSGGFIHSENLVLIDKEGTIRGYYDGTDSRAIKKLLKDIQKLI